MEATGGPWRVLLITDSPMPSVTSDRLPQLSHLQIADGIPESVPSGSRV